MLMNSKSLLRYIRFMFTKEENSVTQGPHQVAHTFIKRSLPELFFINSFNPFSSIISSFTGSFAQSRFAFSTQSLFSAHLTEQPKTFVVVAGTSLLFSSASTALRVSNCVGVPVGFSLLSILPS